MQARTRIALGIASSALALSSGLGIAAAAANDTSAPAGAPSGAPPGGGGPPGAATIASYLGLTGSQIQADFKNGETLAQIATAQGKTADGLEAAIVADAKSHLDAEVSAGTITAAQETSMLANLQSNVAELVNSSGPPAGAAAGPGGPGGPGGANGSGACPPPGSGAGAGSSSTSSSSSTSGSGTSAG